MKTRNTTAPNRRVLPSTYRKNSGNKMSLGKGTLENGKKLYAWDTVQNCLDNDCPAFQYCDFAISKLSEKRKSQLSDLENKCFAQVSYLRDVASLILSELPDIDQITLFKVGSHLMPLYSMWARLKIAELGVRNVVSTGPRGGFVVHPIYRELRDTVIKIEQMWKDTGLEANRWKMEGLGGEGPPELQLQKGSSSYYERVMQSKTNNVGSE